MELQKMDFWRFLNYKIRDPQTPKRYKLGPECSFLAKDQSLESWVWYNIDILDFRISEVLDLQIFGTMNNSHE